MQEKSRNRYCSHTEAVNSWFCEDANRITGEEQEVYYGINKFKDLFSSIENEDECKCIYAVTFAGSEWRHLKGT